MCTLHNLSIVITYKIWRMGWDYYYMDELHNYSFLFDCETDNHCLFSFWFQIFTAGYLIFTDVVFILHFIYMWYAYRPHPQGEHEFQYSKYPFTRSE